MTTMNYPAQYNLIAEEEMTYVTGGTLLSDLKTSLSTTKNYVNAFYYPLNAAIYLVSGAVNVEDGIGSLKQLNTMLNNFSYGIYYLTSTVSSWMGLGWITDFEF